MSKECENLGFIAISKEIKYKKKNKFILKVTNPLTLVLALWKWLEAVKNLL